MAKEKKNTYTGTGHRKTSVARVTLTPGKGKITVNGQDVHDYFPFEVLVMDLMQPLEATKTTEIFDINAEVKGGGFVQLGQVLQSGLVVTPQDIAQLSTVDRLNEIKNLNKNNEIVISPTIDVESEKDQDKAIKEAIKLSEEIGKMSKKEREEFNKNRESKISTDYVIDNFIQTSINIKK